MSDKNKAILHYFDARGLAEIVRLSMAASGIQWTQVDIREREQFLKLNEENKLLFGQLPLIEYDGKLITQSRAASRYFAKKGNILGSNDDEELRITMLFEGTRDFLMPFLGIGFAPDNSGTFNKLNKDTLPKYLPIYERELKTNGSNGHLVGNSVSLADIGLLEVLLELEDWADDIGANASLQFYPNIQVFLDKIRSSPLIHAYLSGPQRPRKKDERIVGEVRKVLLW